jgi:hypothetical protein
MKQDKSFHDMLAELEDKPKAVEVSVSTARMRDIACNLDDTTKSMLGGVELYKSLIDRGSKYIEGDYWVAINSPEQRLKGYKMIEKLYDRIKQYEKAVSDYIEGKKNKWQWPIRDEMDVTVMNMSEVYSLYHEEAKGVLLLELEAAEPIPERKWSSSISKPSDLHFTRQFTDTEQRKLFDGLVNGGFLPPKTIYSHFCYVFGATPIPDNEKPFERLQWNKTKQLLRELLTNDKIKNEAVTTANIESKTPEFFNNKQGNPIRLANNKHVESIDCDNLQEILATL